MSSLETPKNARAFIEGKAEGWRPSGSTKTAALFLTDPKQKLAEAPEQEEEEEEEEEASCGKTKPKKNV